MKRLIFIILVLAISINALAADTKTTALPENTAPATTDIIMIVDDPGGTPASRHPVSV